MIKLNRDTYVKPSSITWLLYEDGEHKLKVNETIYECSKKIFNLFKKYFIYYKGEYDSEWLINPLQVVGLEYDDESVDENIYIRTKHSTVYLNGNRDNFNKLVAAVTAKSKEPLRKFITLKSVKDL